MLFSQTIMADLSEVFELAKIAISRCFFIEPGENDDEIVFSSKRNGIARCNVESRKLVQSWPIIQNHDLTTSCIFHAGEQRYYAVTQDTNLYSWRSSDTHLTNASVKQLNVPDEIKRLLPVTCGGINDLIILDGRGKAYLLSNVSKVPEEPVVAEQSQGRKYIWSTLVSQTELQERQLVVIVEEGQKFKVNFVNLKVENKRLIFEKSEERFLIPLLKGSHLISCTIQEKRLITLWSDNSLCVVDLNFFNENLLGKADNLLQCKLIQKLSPEYKVAGKGISKAKISTINADHVFIVSKYLFGEKRSGVVAVINTKFATEQAKVSFPLSLSESNSAKEQDILSARFYAGHVVLALSNSVMASSCNIRSSSLAASLGRLKRPRSEITKEERTSAVESPFLVTSKLKRSLKEEDWARNVLAKNIEEQKTLNRLADPEKTPTIEEFSAELDKYLKKLNIIADKNEETTGHTTADSSDKEPRKKKRKENPKEKNRNVVVPESFIQAVFNRCLSNDDFWSSKVIVKILKTSCIPQSLCKDLMQKTLEKNSLEIMEKCFRYVKNIQESDVVRCLRHILSLEPDMTDQTKLKTFGRHSAADSVVYDETCFKILLNILNYSFNDYTMQEALRQLNRQETKKLLQTLFHLLIIQSPGIDVGVSHETIVDWLSLVINAQFTSLILANDLAKMLKKIKLTIANQMKLYEKLETIEPYLLYLKKTFKLPKAKKIATYSVETINFDI